MRAITSYRNYREQWLARSRWDLPVPGDLTGKELPSLKNAKSAADRVLLPGNDGRNGHGSNGQKVNGKSHAIRVTLPARPEAKA